jgi:hypothetical protein
MRRRFDCHCCLRNTKTNFLFDGRPGGVISADWPYNVLKRHIDWIIVCDPRQSAASFDAVVSTLKISSG